MNEILKLILDQDSIYERGKLYKNIVYNNFSITEKIPLLYKTNNKRKTVEILDQNNIENDSFYG